ncbi:hypothetical protein K170097C1_58270 [Hungatella effluvii]|uniref:YecA family protein n=1 Tax=Hungatella effluvii TaxID=1096246 RepID=UPI0034BFA6CC
MSEYFYDDLDMELDGLFDLIEDPLIDSFFIKGELDPHLGTSLLRCPKSLQDTIAEEYNLKLGNGKGRKKQLQMLEKRIIEELPCRIEVMSIDDVKMLMTLAEGEEDIADAANGFSLLGRGWVFYYIDNDKQRTIPVVPVEIVEKLKEIFKDRELIVRMGCCEVFRRYIYTLLRLYGVFDKNWLFTVIEKHSVAEESGAEAEEKGSEEKGAEEKGSEEKGSKEKEPEEKASIEKASEEKRAGIAELPETDKLIELLKEQLSRIQKESGVFETNEDYLYASELGDDEDYKKRIDSVRNKLYYEPTEKDIILYRDNYVDKRSKEYHLLKGYLGKKIYDTETLEKLLEELSVEVVEEVGGLFAVPEILERYDCTFSSDGDLKEFEQIFRNWEDQVRKWNNRGFTNAEMKARGECGSLAKIDWNPASMTFKEETPDLDGPCPCGSGKKYRQCCGRGKK